MHEPPKLDVPDVVVAKVMCGIDPFNYVAQIQHKHDAGANPDKWLPWNDVDQLPKPDETD